MKHKWKSKYSKFRKYAHPLHVKEGIITEKVFPVFSESFFWTCFGLVMYIWELLGVTEKFAFQMWKNNIDFHRFMCFLMDLTNVYMKCRRIFTS